MCALQTSPQQLVRQSSRVWVEDSSKVLQTIDNVSHACPKSGVYHSPKNRGLKTTFFLRLRNLMATLTAYISEMKHDTRNRAIVLTTTRDLLHRLKTT